MKSQISGSKDGYELPVMSQPDPLWTVDDVANYLRLKQETIRMMARARKIPALKVGKSWRFRMSEVKDMLGKQKA
jgi:excisionase family DNA binding protein